MLLALSLATPALADCPAPAVAEVALALHDAAPDVRLQLAAQGLAQGCKGPPGFVTGALGVASTPPTQHSIIDMKLALDALDLWIKACPAGPNVLASMARLSPDKQRAHVWKQCELEKLDFATEAEWAAGDGMMVLSVTGWQLMRDSEVAEADAKAVARALAGVR